MTRGRWLLICLAVATLFRLLALWQFADVDLHGDESYYQRAAKAILAGDGHPGSLRPPLFSFFISIAYRLFGESLLALRLTQIGLSLIALTGIFRITAGRFGTRAAAYAGIFCAITPSLVHYTHFVWSECFGTTLLVLFFWALDFYDRSGRTAAIALAGAVLGLNALTRETWLTFGVVVIGWLLWRHRTTWRGAIVPAAAFLGAALLVVLPWTVRNYTVHDAFVLVSTGRWFPMAHGNILNEEDWIRGVAPPREQRLDARSLGELEREAYWRPIALEAIRAEQPAWIFKKLVRNVSLMLQVRSQTVRYLEKGWISPPPASAHVLLVTSVGGHILLTALGLTALWLVPGGWLGRIVVSAVLFTFAIHVIVIAHSRYLVPLMPLMAIHAGALLAGRDLKLSRPRLAGAGLTLVIFAVALILRWQTDLSKALAAIG